MIDLITLTKSGLSDDEIESIVERNDLQRCTRNGTNFYETSKTQKNKTNMYIRIETNRKIKVVFSLHKHHEKGLTCHFTNYGHFTIGQALEMAHRVVTQKGIPTTGLKVYSFEIGLNLRVLSDCRAYLDRMTTIGMAGKQIPLWVNPRYKNERAKTTLTHRTVRKYFKAYDKCFEAQDKRRDDIPNENILRIESVYQRVDNTYFDDFFTLENLTKLQSIFLREWRSLQFEPAIIFPKGMRAGRQELCRLILEIGVRDTLARLKSGHQSGTLTDKIYRNHREFIAKEWESVKGFISVVQCAEAVEFRELLDQEINRY